MGRKGPRASQSLVRTRRSESEMAGGSLSTGTALFHAWQSPASASIRPRHGPAHNPAGPARLRWGTLGLHGPSPDRADGGPCPPIPAWGSQHRTHDSESPANAGLPLPEWGSHGCAKTGRRSPRALGNSGPGLAGNARTARQSRTWLTKRGRRRNPHTAPGRTPVSR